MLQAIRPILKNAMLRLASLWRQRYESGMSKNKIHRIALTGGPGAGKTTAADLVRREIGEKIIVVPEAATMIFAGGFPRSNDVESKKATQETIYHIQKNLEMVQAKRFPNRTLLCDRGTLDSTIYWPHTIDDFMKTVGTSIEKELQRYDAVIFFESAAVRKQSVIEDGNPYRNETIEEAAKLDADLKAIWSQHPNFHFIPNDQSFLKKVTAAIHCILDMIDS